MKYMILAAAALAATLPMAAAQGIATGTAVKVIPAATAGTGQNVRTLIVNDDVKQGDTITTKAGGEAQLIFDDGTKIAVGPNSTLVLEEYVFSQRGKAERVTVSALEGTFRFFSGDSDPSAYHFKTPVANLSIRGTAFDLTTGSFVGTEIVTYEGEVQACSTEDLPPKSPRCIIAADFCDAVALRPGTTPYKLDGPELEAALNDRFEFYKTKQASLLDPFLISLEGCAGYVPAAPLNPALLLIPAAFIPLVFIGGGGDPASN